MQFSIDNSRCNSGFEYENTFCNFEFNSKTYSLYDKFKNTILN